MGAIGASPLFLNASPASRSDSHVTQNDIFRTIQDRVEATPFIDTHEHLIEERGRLIGTQHPRVRADDWTMVFSHYIDSDFRSASMSPKEYDLFFSPTIDPVDKWKILEPYWPFVKNTGYGLASHLSVQQLYDVPELSAATIRKVQNGYENIRKPGFYKSILKDRANIESCQVNSLEDTPFMESAMPDFLMQDLSIVGMFGWMDIKKMSAPTGISVSSLDDWYSVMDWWFDRYGPFATAVKTQNAYSRDIDYENISQERARPLFAKFLSGDPLNADEHKSLQDHLFWIAVDKSNAYNLPVKLHTGYYAGFGNMPLARLRHNGGSATQLCLDSPETRFVFMHINYPNYEELIAAAKNHANCFVDMCWSWLINPIAAKDFLKKYLLTAPANKILTFGGDYIPVEPVLGHAIIARQGISLVLAELVMEGWISIDNALELIDPIMRGNARRLFALDNKEKLLKNKSW
jgi:predicted TIM-barrel fold metal-dependent hydrolase